MTYSLFGLSALVALLPAAVLPWRRLGAPAGERPDAVFWAALGVAVAGTAAWAVVLLSGQWRTGFSVALWVSIAASTIVFAGLAGATRTGWRLAPLLLPYLVLLGVLATIWQRAPERPLPEAVTGTWLEIHIAVSVATYALATLAAVAGLSVFVQERALKGRRPTALTRHLPSIADSERLQVRLLSAAACVLALGLLTGVASNYLAHGALMRLDHKTVFSLLGFGVIAGLLAAHYRTGMRGRRAARVVLVGYLLLTLAYPGVKFVTDVILARG